MYYQSFIMEAEKLTILLTDNGIWFLDPEWKDIICREITPDVDKLEDSYISTWEEVRDILELETKRRNLFDSKKKEVIDWLYETISATIEPAVLEQENDYIKQVIEFMKANKLKSGDTDGDKVLEKE